MSFVKLPQEVFELKLTPIDFYVLCYLLKCRNSITGKCFPSYNKISKECHISRSSVEKAVKQLKEKDIISVTHNYRRQVMRSNSYEIHLP